MEVYYYDSTIFMQYLWFYLLVGETAPDSFPRHVAVYIFWWALFITMRVDSCVNVKTSVKTFLQLDQQHVPEVAVGVNEGICVPVLF